MTHIPPPYEGGVRGGCMVVMILCKIPLIFLVPQDFVWAAIPTAIKNLERSRLKTPINKMRILLWSTSFREGLHLAPLGAYDTRQAIYCLCLMT